MSNDVIDWALRTGRIAAHREQSWRAAVAVDPEGMGDVLRGLQPGGQLGATAAALPPAAPLAPAQNVHATPLVRRLAAARGVDLTTVRGTGAGGRIGKADVMAAAPTTRARPQNPSAATAQVPEQAGNVMQIDGQHYAATGMGIRPVSASAAYWFPSRAGMTTADDTAAMELLNRRVSAADQHAFASQAVDDIPAPLLSDSSSDIRIG